MNNVVIFGIGDYFKYKIKHLMENYKIVAAIDNKCEDNDVLCDGIKLYNPKYIKCIKYDYIFIMVSKRYIYSIANQLLELGANEEKIKFGFNIKPTFDANEELLLSTGGKIFIKNKKIIINYKQKDYMMNNEKDLEDFFVEKQRENDKYIQYIAEMNDKPFSRRFGAERGVPIDRYYIEKFLDDNKKYIRGDVAEIAENTYTLKYGTDVKESYIYHVEGLNGAKRVNLETGEGITENSIDCLILTQTLQTIYNIDKAMKNIKKLLKKNGVALITLPGITQICIRDYNNWGDRWRFTDSVAKEMAVKAGFDLDKIEVKSFGNIKTCFALLYGLCLRDMKQEDFEYSDKQYQMVITVKLIK